MFDEHRLLVSPSVHRCCRQQERLISIRIPAHKIHLRVALVCRLTPNACLGDRHNRPRPKIFPLSASARPTAAVSSEVSSTFKVERRQCSGRQAFGTGFPGLWLQHPLSLLGHEPTFSTLALISIAPTIDIANEPWCSQRVENQFENQTVWGVQWLQRTHTPVATAKAWRPAQAKLPLKPGMRSGS